MVWTELGSVNPNYNWQFYDLPVVGNEVFRVRQAFSSEIRGYALLAQAYGTQNEFYGFRRIYPNNNQSQIIELLIPQEFKTAGNITRYLVIKLATRTRVFDFGWSITIDTFD